MSRVLLTGATGFVGRHLAIALLESGYEVFAVRRSTSNTDVLGAYGKRLHWLSAEDPEGLAERVRQGTPWLAVLHLATAYGREPQPASEVVRANVVFPLELLECAIASEIPLFVATDTCFTPEYPYLQAYTLSKLHFGQLARIMTRNSPIRLITMELQHPYGPGDGPGKFVPWLIRQCLEASRPIELTAGDQEKDFVYVKDVAAAYLSLLRGWKDVDPDTVQCGTGRSTRVREFVESVNRACGGRAQLRFGALDDRPGEVRRSVADAETLHRLGWSPQYSLDTGIAETVETVRTERKAAGLA